MSDNRPSVIERAFQLAKSGRCDTVSEIRMQLAREEYTTADAVRGSALVARLQTLMTAARISAKA